MAITSLGLRSALTPSPVVWVSVRDSFHQELMALVGGQNASSSSSSQFPYVNFFLWSVQAYAISETSMRWRERGEDSEPQLQESIIRCRSAIIVISKGYASSTWCLDKLVLILQCRKTTGLIVLPIFYDVDPSHVRYQRKSFYKAFVRLEERFKSETDDRKREWGINRLAGWRKALKEVANLSGMILKNDTNG